MNIDKFIKNELTNVAPSGCTLKVGDLVEWTNDYGITWRHRVIGFNTTYDAKYVHLDSDAYWFPHDHNKLTLIKE